MKSFIPFIMLGSLIAQTSYPGDNDVRQGVYAFYNYETTRAINILQKAREDYPENPTVHLTWTAAHWLHNQANSTLEKTYIDLENDLNEVIPIYKELVQKHPDDPNYQLYHGSATGLMARIHLGKKEWIKTLEWAYKGFRIIQTVENDHPEIADAALPIGIVEYYAGLRNVVIQFAASLLGLEPGKDVGLEKIERAADEGQWSWIEAKGILSFVYLWVDLNSNLALKHSLKLVEEFPGNFYFRILYTESLIRSRKMNSALTSLNTLKKMFPDLTEIQKSWYYGYFQYEFALYYFLNGDVDKAKIHVNESVNKYGAELDIILANAWFLKGQIHDLNQERKVAVNAYKQCIDLDNYSFVIEDAKAYLKTPYSQ